MKTVKKIALLCALLLLLSGCSMGDPEYYMRPPSASGKYKGLYDALKSKVGNDIVLKFPRSGENLSAIIDIPDKSGSDKAIAIYKRNSENELIHFNLLTKNDGKWVSIDDFEGSSTDIESVQMNDFDGDGLGEMVVSWALESENNMQLAVFSFLNNVFSLDFDTTCTDYSIDNITADDCSGFITFSLDAEKHTSVATFYASTAKLDGKFTEKFVNMSSAKLDGSVTSYKKISKMYLDDGRVVYFADGFKNSGVNNSQAMVTDVVYLIPNEKGHGGKLVAPLSDTKGNINTLSYRNCSIEACDIDYDGKIEIPLLELPGRLSSHIALNDYIITFYEFDFKQNSLKKDFMAYVNFDNKYYIILDGIKRNNSFGVANDLLASEVSFYNNGALLFKIKAEKLNGTKGSVSNGYVKLGETQEILYTGMIREEKNSKLTVEKLREMFQFVKE